MKIEINLVKEEDYDVSCGIFFILIYISWAILSLYAIINSGLSEKLQNSLGLFTILYPVLLLIFSGFLTRIRINITLKKHGKK